MGLEDTIEGIVRRVLREELGHASPTAWQGCLKLSAAAKLADVSVSTIEKWGRAGLRIMRRGHVRRVDIGDLKRFMEQLDALPEVDAKKWAKQTLGNVTPLRGAR